MTKAQERQLSGFVFAAWILAHPASSIVSPEPTVNTLAPSFHGAGGFVRPLPSLYVSGYVATHWRAQQYACSEPALVFPAISGDSRTALRTIGTLMKTQKRFTPDLLDRYRCLGRGKGTNEHYVPWHRVGRSDPASSGRSHLQYWRGRQRELLSDLELVTFLFCTMLVGIADIREQFPLSLEESEHELSPPDDSTIAGKYAGSLSIATELQVKHPKVSGSGRSVSWVMTTDLLLTIRQPDGKLTLLAIAVKPNGAADKKRTKELLAIEHMYWKARGVQWLLITPDLYDGLVAETLRNCVSWALEPQADEPGIDFVAMAADRLRGKSMTAALEYLAAEFGSQSKAQLALWQAIWSGRLPIDLRRGWRPHEPLTLLDPAEFRLLNPITSGRSAWSC